MKYIAAKNNTPSIVVGMVAYHHEPYIAEALDSLLQQKIENLLIIIADDASTDKTVEICVAFQKKYPEQIALILHHENHGVTHNVNSIIPYIPDTTMYVAWLDGDDISLPNKLQKQMLLMNENPDYIISYHDAWVRDDSTGKQYRYNDLWVGQPAHQGDIFEKLITNRCFIFACSVMVRWQLCKHILFRDTVGIRSDWLYYTEIAYLGKAGYLNEVLGVYRRHDNNLTREHPDISSELLIYDYLREHYDVNMAVDKGLIGIYLAYAIKHLMVGDMTFTIKYFIRMILLSLKSFSNFSHCCHVLVVTFYRRLALLLKTGKINR